MTDILSSCRRGIIIIHNHNHPVIVIKNSVSHRRGQSIVQNPPSPMNEMDRRLAVLSLKAAAEAAPSPYPIVVARYQRGVDGKKVQSDVPCDVMLAQFLFNKLVAAKMGRSGQPTQKLGGRLGTCVTRRGGGC